MSKFIKVISLIQFILILTACDQYLNYINVNDIEESEIITESRTENDDLTIDSEDGQELEESKVIDEDIIYSEEEFENLNIIDTGITNEGNLDTNDFSLVQLSKDQFNEFLANLVANPDPDEGIMFLSAEVIYEDTIELKLDLEAGSLEAIWIAPIWDLLIRQLYVNSEFENEPTIIIKDSTGVIISERSEPISVG